MENNNDDELVNSFRAMKDKLQSLSTSVQVRVQGMQDEISRLSAEIEHKLHQLRLGNIQTYSMQMDEALSSSCNSQKRRRSDDPKKLKAPVVSTSGAGRSKAQYRLVIRTDPVGRSHPEDDKKMIVFVKENLSIDVAMMDERGNQVKTGDLASQAVKLVVLNSDKFGHESNGYWTRQEFMDAVLVLFETTNASFQLLEGQSLRTNFTINDSSKRKRVQLGVIAMTDKIISETQAIIREGVSNPFYVQFDKGKSKRMDERSKEASKNPVLPIGSGHHSTDEDSQSKDAMEEDSDKRLAETSEEIQDVAAVQNLKLGDDPYRLGQEIWQSLPSILDKFTAHSNTWRNLWALGNNLCSISDNLSLLQAPPEAQDLNIIDQLRQYIKILEDHISTITTDDQELMQHQHEAKNFLQRALNHLLNLLQTKYLRVPTPTATPKEKNENDTDKYLNPNLNTNNPDGYNIPPRDEQTPGTAPPLNAPTTGANPTASAGHADNSHGASGYVDWWVDPVAFSPSNRFNWGDGYGSFPHDMQGYPSRNQHYNPYAANEKTPITTDVEAVVGYGHEVVALAGPRPAYVHRLRQRRHPTTINDHALYACRRIGFYGGHEVVALAGRRIGPSGRGYYLTKDQFGAMMGLNNQQTVDPFLTAIIDAALRSCLINSGRLFRTSHQQVQDIDEINEMMGRLGIEKHPVAMMRKKVVWTKSQQAAPKHQKIHVVEAEPSVANKQQDGSRAWCGSSEHHEESIDRQFVVLDLKATCLGLDEKKFYSGDRPFEPETIEFSSVLVDTATGDSKSVFHTYVRPIKHEELGSFCMDYNGISQEDVEGEDAVMLSEALGAHRAWLEDNGCGGGGGVVVTTWGDWDCRTMLKQECQRKQLHIPGYLSRWMNLKKPFAETYDIDKVGVPIHKLRVQDAVRIAGLEWKGHTEKGGQSHARNKARLLKLLILAGAKLSITGWLDRTPAARQGVTE